MGGSKILLWCLQAGQERDVAMTTRLWPLQRLEESGKLGQAGEDLWTCITSTVAATTSGWDRL